MAAESKIKSLSYQNRDFYKREFGCVIRSFESALRVRATEEEWDLQFNQLDDLLNQFGFAEVAANRRGSVYYADIQNVLGLTLVLQENNTPLGNALRSHQVLYTPGDGRYINKSIAAGRKVLYAKPFHLAHLVRLPGTSYLHTISDPQPRLLSPGEMDSRLDLFVLTPRST